VFYKILQTIVKNNKRSLLVISSLMCGWGHSTALEATVEAELEGELPNAKKKLTDQFREVMYEVLRATRLVSEEEEVTQPPDGEGDAEVNVYASVQRSLGMTEYDVAMGGNIKQRLESVTRTVEANNRKLTWLIAALTKFQQETRRNMNFVMEDIAILKAELHKVRGLLFAHDVNTQKIINNEPLLECEIMSLLRSIYEEIKDVVEQPPVGPFTPYDITEKPKGGWSGCPHGSIVVEEENSGSEVGSTGIIDGEGSSGVSNGDNEILNETPNGSTNEPPGEDLPNMQP
jgi:hypothetical protein